MSHAEDGDSGPAVGVVVVDTSAADSVMKTLIEDIKRCAASGVISLPASQGGASYSFDSIDLSVGGVRFPGVKTFSYQEPTRPETPEEKQLREELEVCSEIHEEPIVEDTIWYAFGDSMTGQHLSVHAQSIYGLQRKSGESDCELRERMVALWPSVK